MPFLKSFKNQSLLPYQKLSLVSVFILFSFSAQSFYRIETITKKDQPVSHAIWNIKVGDIYYPSKKMGTAFFISPTQIITSLHVIDSLLKPSPNHLDKLVLTHHNLRGIFRVKKILRLSYLYDLALLEVDQTSPSFLDLVENPSPSDDKLYVIGYHNSGHNKEGEFDKFKQTSPLIDLDYGEISINHSHLKGFNGSPVLLNGKVRGVVSISLQNLLNFISVNDIKFFLKEEAFLCHSPHAEECLNSAKDLFIKSPQQDLKYYYNLLLSVFTPEIIRSKKNAEEKKEFWQRFETAIAGLEELKQRKNNPSVFSLLSEYYHFNSYQFSSLEPDKIRNNSQKSRDNLEKGALSGDRYSQYTLSYVKRNSENPPSSQPLLSSSKMHWLLKAGQNHLSHAQYELGKIYYKYHQNPFLNDFILQSTFYEDFRLLTDSKKLLFNPSLNFKTQLSQWLSSTNPEILQQAQSDLFQQTKPHYLKTSATSSEKINTATNTPHPLLELSNPYNPYNESKGIASALEKKKAFIKPSQAKLYYQSKYDFYNRDKLQEDFDFSLFEYQNQRQSLLAPEDQQIIQSYQDLLRWISDKEKQVYEVMSHIGFHKKLSEITGCEVPQNPPFSSLQKPSQPYFNPLKNLNDTATTFNPHSESFLDDRVSVALNFLLGKYWLIKAVEQGYAEAQYLLAELYAKNKNRPLAEYWLIKALNQNETYINRHSLYLLGIMYANVKEVNKKREICLADFWLRSAIAHHDYRAEVALKKMIREERNFSVWEEGNYMTGWYKWQPGRKNPNQFDVFKNLTGEFSNDFFVEAPLTEEQRPESFNNKNYDDFDSLRDDESILFNKTAPWRGEVLLDRNSSLLNQDREIYFYELFHYQEPVWNFKASFPPTPTKRLETTLHNSSLPEEINPFFDEELEVFLKKHPESIYQIAEESSLLWNDTDFD